MPSPAADTYEGTVYVDTENFAVVQYEAFTTRRPQELTKPRDLRRLGFAQPLTRYRQHHDLYQYEPVQGTCFLKYARRESATDFVRRDTQQRQRWQDLHELLTTDVELATPHVLHTTLFEVDAQVPYRADFWNTYQVLLPTEAKH
ncbi:hypothetical protein [Hymenobacter profundi]|uniref:Uncharacterized protein n=1 Tax=Hymenobacter profundi TaxID=1982110 RepID=A0ABS6WYG7_9BACT|nr:hypothetical protein [Hymenobacter profundi]MBW3128647.1 hypothetical protein [Hymenobacter profundi]